MVLRRNSSSASLPGKLHFSVFPFCSLSENVLAFISHVSVVLTIQQWPMLCGLLGSGIKPFKFSLCFDLGHLDTVEMENLYSGHIYSFSVQDYLLYLFD